MERDEELLRRIAACAPDVREWAALEGYENLGAHIASGVALTSSAQGTLTVLLAGIGGTAAYAAAVLDGVGGMATKGAGAVCAYLVALSALLVVKCLHLAAAPMLHNEPTHLLVPGATLEQLRAGELHNLQLRIAQQAMLNRRRAAWLNALRGAALGAPAAFVLGAVGL